MKQSHLRALQRVYLVLLFSFMYVPIAVMAVFSFNESKSRTIFTGFTFKWYKSLFLNAMGKRSQAVINNISYMPVVNPEIITGVSLMLLFVVVKDGIAWANQNLGWTLPENIFGLPTLLIAHISFCLPYVIFNVSPKLRQLDVRVYEAALDLGCNPKQAFFKVVLPELAPAILSAFLICLTYSIDDFLISYFTSGTTQTLPIVIYSMTRKKVSPEINALSTVMFLVILAIILFYNYLDGRREARKA